ncbi:MAG: Hsp33 family molecular chaperone HslO [Tepidimonas sp.]|uniref:Hsp33 family molecular chaperone HslO n=1 Tax=Tepidimonas sp. TaxID=2002775 RepID=UPI00259FA984|nr:Hsp33 family molecular chaperone HslO [Tepidimonas sp.]MDM7456322.1 Hsp33 family molecular chaperone HslO [Tepidimonas sp.]
MSELHKFLFDGVPVRGALVRLTDGWQELLRRRQSAGGYPPAVMELLGEMVATAVLLHSNIKFAGALVLQIFGDGPVKVAVAEVQPDLSFRATATVRGEVGPGVPLSHMVNVLGQGRCAITLDPRERQPGQQPYQGVVPLTDAAGRPLERLSDVIGHYMQQSEQLDTRLVLAADASIAAGLLIQRMPAMGQGNLSGTAAVAHESDALGANEDFHRIATLASSLTRQELLGLDADTILHRLFWQENLLRLAPSSPAQAQPRFACTCSRERVGAMLRGLGVQEVEAILAEQGEVDVGCDFCGLHYRFDPVDAARLFLTQDQQPPGSDRMQ